MNTKTRASTQSMANKKNHRHTDPARGKSKSSLGDITRTKDVAPPGEKRFDSGLRVKRTKGDSQRLRSSEADLRRKHEALLHSNPKHRVHYIVKESGELESVVLPIGQYEALMQDLADLAMAAERRDEKTSDHAEVLARLKADGFL